MRISRSFAAVLLAGSLLAGATQSVSAAGCLAQTQTGTLSNEALGELQRQMPSERELSELLAKAVEPNGNRGQ